MSRWSRHGLSGPEKLGFLPPIKRFLIKRRIKSIERRVDSVGKAFCALADEARKAKEEAARVFTKNAYDPLEESLDRHFREACACSRSVTGVTQTHSQAKRVTAEMKRHCIEVANRETGLDWKSSRGRFSTKDPEKLALARRWKETYDRCLEENE